MRLKMNLKMMKIHMKSLTNMNTNNMSMRSMNMIMLQMWCIIIRLRPKQLKAPLKYLKRRKSTATATRKNQ
jgi:hypothetical protein